MRSKITAVISCLLACFLTAINVSALTPDEIAESIITYELDKSRAETVQEWLDTDLAKNAGNGSEWYAITLSKSGEYDFSAYKAALEAYVESTEIRSATSRQKYALALLAVDSSSDYIAETMENSIGEQGLMSYVYGLHLLNNGCTSTQHTAESVTAQILSMQLADGGWAVIGEYGDPDVTAMTLQALAPYYITDETAQTAIDSAVQFLSEKQLDSGGYKSMGKETSESISQVIIALSALEIDAETDSRFARNGNTLLGALGNFRFTDGSFCHEIGSDGNSTATVQAYMAALAYSEMKAGRGSMYLFGNEEKRMETQTEISANETEIMGNEAEMSEGKALETAEKHSYKPVACVIIVAAFALTCAVLILLKKNNKNNFLVLGILAVIAVLTVLFTDFSTAEDYYGTAEEKENTVGTVTVEIRCDTVAGKADYIPESGVVLEKNEFVIAEGETVYDILVEACRENGIQTEFSGGYVSGINYIYEFDFGDLSGWLYYVNGKEASVGCDQYILSDGDEIKWLYSLEMGNDLK